MLVLARKTNESIIINDDITVTVVGIEDGEVNLQFEAPADVTVHRRELYEEIFGQAGLKKKEVNNDPVIPA